MESIKNLIIFSSSVLLFFMIVVYLLLGLNGLKEFLIFIFYGFLSILIVIGIFYFILIRPLEKRMEIKK